MDLESEIKLLELELVKDLLWKNVHLHRIVEIVNNVSLKDLYLDF